MLCAKCNADKAESEFVKNKRRKSGLFPYCKVCHREGMRSYRVRVNELDILRKRYANDEEYRKKVKARALVNMRRTRAGRKQEQCFSCNTAGAEAHHPDYDRPDFIIFLCKGCHAEEHSKYID